MLEQWLTRLYTRLLRYYPSRFQDEFGGEMVDVFAQELSGLKNISSSPAARRLKMARSFFREVWYFPLAYLDARRYKASLSAGDTPVGRTSYGDVDLADNWMNRRPSWGEALLGALLFLLFGLSYLLDGFSELAGQSRPVFVLLKESFNRPVVTLTAEMVVYFLSALGLLLGVFKGFPRWSYAYLGMSLWFGWIFSNQLYYGVFHNWWVWLPTFVAILLGLLLARSIEPLARLFQGVWNDWTRLSFAIYAFALPMLTVVFFDGDWGINQLYILFFDTLLLAAGAVAFLRSGAVRGRVLSMMVVVLVLVVKGVIGGGFDRQYLPPFLLAMIGSACLLLLPAVIGLLRRGMGAFSSQ